jgi:hypothetical protein
MTDGENFRAQFELSLFLLCSWLFLDSTGVTVPADDRNDRLFQAKRA